MDGVSGLTTVCKSVICLEIDWDVLFLTEIFEEGWMSWSAIMFTSLGRYIIFDIYLIIINIEKKR